MTLQELSMKAGTDKGNGHSYIPWYENLFEGRKDSVKKILEVGIGPIQEGRSSLFMWRDYFPNAQIYGIDNDEKKMGDFGDRIQLFLCDQSDEKTMKKLGEHYGPFDLIVEDGSHEVAHQISTAKSFVPFLADNGMYVIEDVSKPEEIQEGLSGFDCELHIFNGLGDALMTVCQSLEG